MSATQQDVANKLGVSREWISRALSGDPRISAASRLRVETAAREVGYRPQANTAARTMAARRHGRRARTHTLGVLEFDHQPTPYSRLLMTGIRRAAERREQEIVVLHSASSAGLERVDGVIGESKSPEWYRQLPVAVPFIAVNAARPDLCCVEFDHRDGALQATRHLVGLGHRRIGHLLYLDAEVVSERLRSEGYRAGLREAGIDPLPVWERQLRDYGDFVVRGRRNMTEWLADGFVKTGITALLVQNDRAAIGAMQALHQAGLRVPQDISIVGFDGTDECELSTPRLTSVRAPLEAAGESAVEGLLRQITEGVGAPQTVVLPVELELRDSTAPPG